MKRDEFSGKLREYVKNHVSLTQKDRDFVNAVYEAFRDVLGGRCIQIGSYPRFGRADFRVLITLESRDEASLKRAAERLRTKIPWLELG